MEYTTTLSDCLPTIVCGSDEAFRNPPWKPEVSLAEPLSSADSLFCHCAQGAESETRVCPNRQACYRTLSAWHMRHGQYQRADITGYDRLEIAWRFHNPDRTWGEVSEMARGHGVSRQTIYGIAGRVEVLFEPRLPGPVPCLKWLLPCGGISSEATTAGGTLTREEKERIRGRLTLTSVFPGGVTMRPLEDILEAAPVKGCSDTTIWRRVSEAGARAYQILTQVDYQGVSLPLILADVDETFFDGRPNLFIVEPISLAICGFHVPADGDRSALTWSPLLLILQEDQHLDIYGGVGDAAKPYPGAFKAVLEQDGRFQEDVFHPLRDLQALRRKLENNTYRAFAAEYETADQWRKNGTAETQEQLQQARAESVLLAQLHDDFAEYSTWVADAFQIVDLRSGEIRNRQINEWLLNEATTKMGQLNHTDVIKMSERLNNHKDRLLVYLDWLDERLSPLRAELHDYLDDPELERVVLQAVARRWRLQHEVESMQRRAFRPALKRAEQELAIWIAGDAFLEQWSEQVRMFLELVQRASSAAENINSIFKPLVNRKKHFDDADTNLYFVALFVLWHNMRVFKEGKRKGCSPFDILGIDLGERDWRTLLGYPPVL